MNCVEIHFFRQSYFFASIETHKMNDFDPTKKRMKENLLVNRADKTFLFFQKDCFTS